MCVSSLRRGHANLLCIVPILTDDPRRESNTTNGTYDKMMSGMSGCTLTLQRCLSARLWRSSLRQTKLRQPPTIFTTTFIFWRAPFCVIMSPGTQFFVFSRSCVFISHPSWKQSCSEVCGSGRLVPACSKSFVAFAGWAARKHQVKPG